MELYKSIDVEVLKDNIESISETIDSKKLEMLEPTKTELLDISKIVLKFIADNKRKVYGGYAQNKIISRKNPDDAFYSDDIVPDIDFYSPDPIVDVKKICNILHDKGYKYVQGRDALHEETYKVYVNFGPEAADISYVPNNVYTTIPYIEIDGIRYVHPTFSTIDVYRMFTDPFSSAFRWDKMLSRLMTIQKHYPFDKPGKKLPDIGVKPHNKLILKTVHEFLENNSTTIVYGLYAYNCYLLNSGAIKNKQYRYIELPYYEFVSTDYKNDVQTLIKNLKKHSSDVTVTEFYKFWQFLGFNCKILVDGKVVAYVVDYNGRCTPTKKIQSTLFNNKESKVLNNKFIQIGSFDFTMLMLLIMWFRMKVVKNDHMTSYYRDMRSHLAQFHKLFFTNSNQTLVDDTFFQSFGTECVGVHDDPKRRRMVNMVDKKRKNLRMTFSYVPEFDYKSTPTTNIKFLNSSGNAIDNPKNLQITSK